MVVFQVWRSKYTSSLGLPSYPSLSWKPLEYHKSQAAVRSVSQSSCRRKHWLVMASFLWCILYPLRISRKCEGAYKSMHVLVTVAFAAQNASAKRPGSKTVVSKSISLQTNFIYGRSMRIFPVSATSNPNKTPSYCRWGIRLVLMCHGVGPKVWIPLFGSLSAKTWQRGVAQLSRNFLHSHHMRLDQSLPV